jgi:hypothetical protein
MLVYGATGRPNYINTTGNPNSRYLPILEQRMSHDNQQVVQANQVVPSRYRHPEPQANDIDIEEEEEEYDTWGIALIMFCYQGKYDRALSVIKDLIKTNEKKYNMSLQNPDGNTALGHVINGYNSSTSPKKEELIELLIKDFSIKYPTDDECAICLKVLDGIQGPSDDGPAADNDVITVCVNSHRFHRKCIIGVCDTRGVEDLHLVQQSCPMCREKLIPSCTNNALGRKIKLPLPIPVEFKKFIPPKNKEGGRQIRKKPIKNKLVKNKPKSKKNKLVKTKTKSKKNKLVKNQTKKKE